MQQEAIVISTVGGTLLLLIILWVLISLSAPYRQKIARKESYLKYADFERETAHLQSLLPPDYKKRLAVTFFEDKKITVNLHGISSAALTELSDDEMRFLLAWNIATARLSLTESLPFLFAASVPLLNLVIKSLFPNVDKSLTYLILLLTIPLVCWLFARWRKTRMNEVPSIIAKADAYGLRNVDEPESAISAIQKTWLSDRSHNAASNSERHTTELRIERLKLLLNDL